MDHISHDPITDDSAEDAAAQRNDARDSLLLVARFRVEGSTEITQVRVRNLSSGGLMADIPKPIDIGTMVEVEVRGVGWVNGRIAWVAAGWRFLGATINEQVRRVLFSPGTGGLLEFPFGA